MRLETADGDDRLIRALLRTRSIRVVVATTTHLAGEAARRHGAVGAVATALGRAATAGLLLATMTKERERVTAEIAGDGPLGRIIVDANAAGEVRVHTRSPSVSGRAFPGARFSLAALVGTRGSVRVARDLGLREVVSGHTAIVDGEIDTDLENYLTASEQVPSVLACETLLGPDLDVSISAGVLFQTLPQSPDAALLENIRRSLRGGLLAPLLAGADHNLAPEEIAARLLPELASDLAVLDSRPLRFSCPCSKERAAATLALLGPRDLGDMVRSGDTTTVTCEFCRAQHVFSADELKSLARSSDKTHPPAS